MNVFVYELKQYKNSIISWAVAYAVSVFVFMSATPLFIRESSGMREMLTAFPDAVKSAMGIDINVFFSAVGFYSYIFLYLGLVAAIQAMNLGLGIISKENRMKTADFLLSKPRSRVSVFWQKILAALCALGISEIVFFAISAVTMVWQSGGDFPVRVFVLISLPFAFIQLIFLATGVFVATVSHKIKSTLTVSMGICFGLFIVGLISGIADSAALRYLSPLRYFDNTYIMVNGAYETSYLAIWAVLTIVLAAASFAVYVKKDVRAVS